MTMTSSERKVLLAQQRRAQDLSPEFFACRSMNHHQFVQVAPDRTVDFGEILAFQCIHCTTVRYDVISPQYGEILDRSYRYPPGYRQEAPEDGSRLFSAAAMRVERQRRAKAGQIELRQLVPLLGDDVTSEP